MSKENYDEDFYDEEDYESEAEFGDSFLSDENDEYVNMIMIPRIDLDVDDMVDNYVQMLRRCKTNDDAKSLLYEFYAQVSTLTIIQTEQEYIQERVTNLEMLMEQIKLK